jgi:hypothetical protein
MNHKINKRFNIGNILFYIVMIGIIINFFYQGNKKASMYKNIKKNGIEKKAIVTSYRRSSNFKKARRGVFLNDYKFIVDNFIYYGKIFGGEYSIGDTIIILYLPDNPACNAESKFLEPY